MTDLREQIAALVRDAQQAAGTWGASGRTLAALTEAVDAIEQLVEAQVAQAEAPHTVRETGPLLCAAVLGDSKGDGGTRWACGVPIRRKAGGPCARCTLPFEAHRTIGIFETGAPGCPPWLPARFEPGGEHIDIEGECETCDHDWNVHAEGDPGEHEAFCSMCLDANAQESMFKHVYRPPSLALGHDPVDPEGGS